MSNDTELNDVTAEVSIEDGGAHQSSDYQLLAGDVADSDAIADHLENKAVSVSLRDGDSMIRIGLTAEQARRLGGELSMVDAEP